MVVATKRLDLARLVLFLIPLAGCNSQPAPPTHPVTGKVVYKKSGEPLAGGTIQFKSVADPSLTTIGEVQKDGTFTLKTLVGSRHVPGAVEGQHQVVLVPAQDENQKFPSIRLLKSQYQVKPEANEFVIEIEKTP